MSSEIVKSKAGKLSPEEQSELAVLTNRLRERLTRTAGDILAIGAELTQAKELLGHGRFGTWLDAEFSLSRRSAEQFMSAARRFGSRSEVVSHLPAGAVLELSAPSVPDELVERVIAGEVPPTVSAIRAERSGDRIDQQSHAAAGTFIDYLWRFKGDRTDYAAGVAAHVIRRWEDPADRAWFARCMRTVAEMIEDNLEAKVPMLELPRTTVRKLREQARTEP